MNNKQGTTIDALQQELEELRKKSDEREAELKASNQQLNASNQQLESVNHRLQAADQQLRASNQQLEAYNQQLMATELQLRISNHQLRETSSLAKVGGWQINIKSNALRWTSETYNIHELTEDKEPSVDDAIAFYHPDDQKMVRDAVEKAIKNSQSFDYEARIITAKKNLRWVRVLGKILKQGDKDVGVKGVIQDVTNIKNAESRLKDSEAKYRSLYENAPLSYQSLDIEGNFIDINPTWLSTLGYKREEVIGKNFADFLYSDSKDHFAKNFPAFKKRGYVSDVQFKIRHKNGHYRYISFEGCIGTHPDGSFKQTYCVFKDITDQKHAEEELEKQNADLSALNKFSLELTMLSSLDNIEEVICQRLKDITGAEVVTFSSYNRDGKTLTTQHIEVAPSLLQKASKLMGKQFTKIEAPVNEAVYHEMTKGIVGYRRTLHEVTFGVISKPVGVAIEALLHIKYFIGISYIIEGELYGTSILGIKRKQPKLRKEILKNLALVVAVSLRRRKAEQEMLKAKEAAEESELQFRNLFENAADAIFIANYETGIIVDLNQAAEDMTQKKADQIIGQHQSSLHPHQNYQYSLDTFKQHEEQLASSNRIATIHNEVLRKDGSTVPVEILATQVVYKGQKCIVGTFRDISYRKQTEKALIEAKEKAEESDRLKTAFLANMSHEIRTPMNGILGFTELLKNPKLSGEKMDQYIKIIEKSGQRMLNTINDIVDISRIEAGQVEVQNSEVPINATLKELYDFFSNEAHEKGIELVYSPSLSTQELIIVTDKHKLEGILTNLIKNAIKYTEEGEIYLGCQANEKEGTLDFYVKDTGIGIASDRLEAIFNRFEQADIEDTRAFQGSGLGLAISRSYAEMLGGRISVSSEEGVGSVFSFSLPAFNRVDNSDSERQEKNEVPHSFGRLKMLIAEDDETSQIYLSTLLENKLKSLILVDNGLKVVQTIKENPDVDVVLMDIKMPELNGYEATRQIRAFNKKVIIIAQTAYGLSGDRQKALDAGCDEYISKPIAEDELLAKISTCLQQRR